MFGDMLMRKIKGKKLGFVLVLLEIPCVVKASDM